MYGCDCVGVVYFDLRVFLGWFGLCWFCICWFGGVLVCDCFYCGVVCYVGVDYDYVGFDWCLFGVRSCFFWFFVGLCCCKFCVFWWIGVCVWVVGWICELRWSGLIIWYVVRDLCIGVLCFLGLLVWLFFIFGGFNWSMFLRILMVGVILLIGWFFLCLLVWLVIGCLWIFIFG